MAPSQQTNRRRTAIVTLWSLLLSPGGLVEGHRWRRCASRGGGRRR